MIKLDYSVVKNDGQYHIMWQSGNISIRGYSGEFNSISLNVFVGEQKHYSSYSLRRVTEYIESLNVALKGNHAA